MLIYLTIFQTLLIVWLLIRTPSHNPLQNTFIEVFNRLEKIEQELYAIRRRLGPSPDTIEEF